MLVASSKLSDLRQSTAWNRLKQKKQTNPSSLNIRNQHESTPYINKMFRQNHPQLESPVAWVNISSARQALQPPIRILEVTCPLRPWDGIPGMGASGWAVLFHSAR